MAEEPGLTHVELAALVSVLRLSDEGYGVTIRSEIEERTGRTPSIAAVYAALERLESRGFVDASLSAPLPERGGRAKRQYRITRAGAVALRGEMGAVRRLWEGVDLHPALRPR